MIYEEAAAVLGKIQAYDNRTVSSATVAAWHEALGAIPVQDALIIVAEHYARSREWIMPSDINTRVAELHRQRVRDAGPPDFPSDLTAAQERSYRDAYFARIRAGLPRDEATAETDHDLGHERGNLVGPPAGWAKQLEGTFRSIDKAGNQKPRRWGKWRLRDRVLYFDRTPYGIELDDLRRSGLDFWVEHIGGKGWGTTAVVSDLKTAYRDLIGEAA